MFYLGVFFGENITFAVIEKTLKNLENNYCLKAVSQFSSDTDSSEIEDKIISIYNDRKLMKPRRVFSQNRRPSKTVITPPVIVANFTGTDTARIDALRKRKIPAEGISLYHGGQWKKEDYASICLGNNYYVPEHDLIRTLTTVRESKRLMIAEEIPDAEDLIREINKLGTETGNKKNRNSPFEGGQVGCLYTGIGGMFPADTPLRPPQGGICDFLTEETVISALSLPIWFCENVRIIKRY
jgi:hypothetical protein